MKNIITLFSLLCLMEVASAQTKHKSDGDMIFTPTKTDSVDFKSNPSKKTPTDTVHLRSKKRMEYVDSTLIDNKKPKKNKLEIDSIK